MQQNILYVGLDVDDTQYHGSAFSKDSGEVVDFKCRPTLKGLLNQLDKLAGHFPGCSMLKLAIRTTGPNITVAGWRAPSRVYRAASR